jgi:hypothetical protein
MNPKNQVYCPGCDDEGLDRRDFLGRVSAMVAAAAGTVWATPRMASAAPTPDSPAEKAVKALYGTLTDDQKKQVCFDWDHKDSRGLLRMHVSNNWHITKPTIDSSFYTKDQKALIRDVFTGIFNPEWTERLDKQLKDDTNGRAWGADQNIAIFGTPGSGKFKFVMTGRHLTCRCDGDSEASVPWGGPIFHGHAASGFNEKVGHPGNVFWHQAQAANKLYQVLNGKQQEQALVARLPAESAVSFRGAEGKFPGLPCSELTRDQRDGLEKVLASLLDPSRKEDQEEILEHLKKQGGLEKCALAFYKQGDLGDDGEWDNWRIEGPSFVWYFRGFPHVHIWVNIADNAKVETNAKG